MIAKNEAWTFSFLFGGFVVVFLLWPQFVYAKGSPVEEESLFLVLHKKLFGYIDQQGKIKINFKFRNATDFNEGMAAVSHWKSYGYIDTKGKFVIKPRYCFAGMFNEGLAWVKEKWGDDNLCIDKTGKVMFSVRAQRVQEFSEGMAVIVVNDKYGYVNNKGQVVIEPKFDSALDFSNGLACVEQGELWGFIDKAGKYVIDPKFSKANSFFASGRYFCYIKKENDERSYSPSGEQVTEPTAFVTEKGKKDSMLINKNGKTIKTKCGQDFSVMSSDELSLAYSGGKWGFIDKSGKFIIQPKFEDGRNFHLGLALVELNGKYIYINEKGNKVASTGIMLND